MFKYGSVEDELYHSMEKTLIANQVEDTHGFSKLAKAADYLNAAAQMFDNAGMYQQAAEITEVLQELAAELSCKNSF